MYLKAEHLVVVASAVEPLGVGYPDEGPGGAAPVVVAIGRLVVLVVGFLHTEPPTHVVGDCSVTKVPLVADVNVPVDLSLGQLHSAVRLQRNEDKELARKWYS